jgi:hypothetical protein
MAPRASSPDLSRRIDLVQRPISGLEYDEHIDVGDIAERELSDGRVDDVDLMCSGSRLERGERLNAGGP